jgi:CheY-like chemotaxis protein
VQLPREDLILLIDPQRITQVLSNLLDNAAKYTPQGGQIKIAAETRKDTVSISVSDNGVGIPADMLNKIFDMFTRSDRDIEKTHPGLGIGLSLVKSIVEMHGGAVMAVSDPVQRGTQIRVQLPLARVAAAIASAPVPAASPPSLESPMAQRVLVVDDNRDAANLLGVFLDALGNDVRVAHDGREAIQVAQEFLPSVVLMDLGMPIMNGYSAARHIREQSWGQEMLLVALSGWGQDVYRQRAKEAGFDHHLVKPADPVDLERILTGMAASAPDKAVAIPSAAEIP